jgi:hypothetical protein
MTAREVAEELDRINKRLGDRTISRTEYEALLKERNRQTRELISIRQENDVLRARADDARAEYLRDKNAVDKQYRDQSTAERKAYLDSLERQLSNVYGPADRNVYPVGANVEGARRREAEAAARRKRGNVKPEAKPEKPKDLDVGNKRDPNANKPTGPQTPIPTGNKGQHNPRAGKGGAAIVVLPSGDSSKVDDATSALIRATSIGPEDFKPGQDPGPLVRISSRIYRDIANGFARVTPLATIINAVAEETGLYKAKPAQAQTALGSVVSTAQVAALLQQMHGQQANQSADLAALTRMAQAQASYLDSVMGVLSNLVALTAPIAAMSPTIASTHYLAKSIRDKVGAANFTLQNQAATLTKAKLGALDVAQLMNTSRLAEPKLKTLDAAQLMNTSRLAEKKWNILDATQLMNTSRLAEKKWNILDATQMMNTSRLAEKKWNILDATQLMQTSRLAEKKWNILDATQLMGTSRLAEKKWSIIDATQLMKDTRQIPAIFQELQKPLKLPAEIARKSDIAAIKFPSIPSDLARKSDIKTVTIPNDLARKSDVTNIKVPTPIVNLPAPIVNIPAPDIGGIVQAVNQTLNQQTTNITNIFNRSYQGLTQANLDQAVGNVNNYTNAVATTVISQVNTHTTRQAAEVKGGISVVAQQAEAIKTDVGDVAKVLGVPQLKPGLSVKPDADLKAIGVKTDNGNAPGIAQNIPQLMMMLAAVPYVRQGLHRLGGSFDTSVMNPQRGKTKITDAMGFQQWSFNQLEERMGMPSTHTIVTPGGQTQTKAFRSLEDALEENNANTIVAMQDLEVIERYVFALTQDMQKLMQITLQTREDVDVLIDDSGCKTKEVKKSHPSHINLTNESAGASLSGMFQRGRVHYVAREWAGSADKNQVLQRISYDTQIAAMSNKFELDKTTPELPLQKSRAADKPLNDELWRTYVSTMEEPPEGYVSKGNPIPDIQEIKNGNPTNVPKPTNPLKKLGK